MKPLTINVDSDGVVVDFTGAIRPYIEAEGHEVDVTQWNLGLERHVFDRIFGDAISQGVFAKAPAIPGAIEGLNALIDAGHRVRIVTAKMIGGDPWFHNTFLAQTDTLVWYDREGLLEHVEMVFTGSRWGKAGYPADVVIDDKPTLEWTQRFAHNILFNQPWNEGADLRSRPGLSRWRTDDWSLIVSMVEEFAKGAAA